MDTQLIKQAPQWLSSELGRLAWFWQIPIVTVSGREIRVSNIIIALMVLVIGLLFSKLLSKGLEKHLFKKLRFTVSASASARIISRYVLMVFFIFLALHFANIPLAVFTFFGGAIALGVGFGSQNVVNNFISGLIVLFERPVKVGDFVEIEHVLGKVDHIGPRSTRLLKTDNTHVILPNSWLIEKKVLNWNYQDKKIRTSVQVGVAYGSPVETVLDVLKKSCEVNSCIKSNPAPAVIFQDFGDNALQFEVLFWVEVQTLLERRQIESELRRQINQSLSEKKITIAFPQRDVHLFSEKAIPVRVVSSKKDA